MNQEELTLYNKWLAEIEWINIENTLSCDEESNLYKATFEVPIRNKDDLTFEMKLGKSYPNNNIKFYCINEDGYDHQMPDGLICHNPDIYFNNKEKFSHEFDKLRKWIDKFYIREEKSSHYEHLQFSNTINKHLLFTELNLEHLESTKLGYFNYIQLNEFEYVNDEKIQTYILMNVSEINSSISNSFKQLARITQSDIQQGVWLHLEERPTLYRRKTISNWSDLLNLFFHDQISHLYNFRDLIRKKKGSEGKFFILISYPIYNTEESRTEAHLELIEDNVFEDPQETKYKNLELYSKINRQGLINWGKTSNIAYSNFFGRGALTKKLAHNKILIFGIGAIGSSLAKILVRGGLTNLGLVDLDIVESGNICRSEYRPISIQEFKTHALAKELVSISPFLEVSKHLPIHFMNHSDENLKKRKRELQQYDIIFDCTTDKYFSNILDQMNLHSTIFNLSISNKAKEFVCITGSGNITNQKKKIYEKLDSEEVNEPFFPEVGCFQPTFEASYNDINLLLNYALKEIDQRLKKEIGVQSFIIRTQEDVNGFKIKLDYDL